MKHELVVLGGGPAGYVAAIRAAQLGIDVACIDENPRFGGTCLRVGCIPSKALLESSHLVRGSQHRFGEHGITVAGVELDLDVMMARKDKIVDTLTGGIDLLFKKRGVTPYRGRGRFLDVNTIQVDGDEPTTIEADQVLICTGSRPARLRRCGRGQRPHRQQHHGAFVSRRSRAVRGDWGWLHRHGTRQRLESTWQRSDRVWKPSIGSCPGSMPKLARWPTARSRSRESRFAPETFVESAKRDGDKCVVKVKDADPIECDRVLLATGRDSGNR